MNLQNICIFIFSTTVITDAQAAVPALLIIDAQECFMPDGTLPVAGGDEIIPIINDLRTRFLASFELIVVSQDWHCPDHVSFASQHSGYDPLDIIDLYYNSDGELCRTENISQSYTVPCEGQMDLLQQTLWTDHCVINTTDADIHPELIRADDDVIIQKGSLCYLDSYSVFYDNGQYSETTLRQTLEHYGITSVYLTGLATDYCVYWSATDAHNLGYETYVVLDATRGIAEYTVQAAVQDMINRGIHVINSTDVESLLSSDAPLGLPQQYMAHYCCISISILMLQIH